MKRRLSFRILASAALASALTVAGAPAATASSEALSAPAQAAPSSTLVFGTASSAALNAALGEVRDSGGRVLTPLDAIHGAAVEMPAGGLERLRAIPGVSVSANERMEQTEANWGQNSGVASAVHPQVTRSTQAWHHGVTGKGVSVAVLDTGVTPVGDLAGRVVGGVDLTGENDPYKDSYGHGTFVAGIIAGDGASSAGSVKGTAPAVNVVPVKVAGADGYSDVVRVVSGIGWVIEHKDQYNIRVLNLSLGTDSKQSWRVDPLNYAVQQAWRAGIVVVVSAGNGGGVPGSITKPGDDPYVVTVGAIDDRTTVEREDDLVAPYTSSGPTAAGLAKPDLVAPGSHIVSLRAPGSTVDVRHPSAAVAPEYFKGTGTSFSSPQVAAAAALMLQKDPLLTPDLVKARLVKSARPAPSSDAHLVGSGVLDTWSALQSSLTTPANQSVGAWSTGMGTIGESQGSPCIRVGPRSEDMCITDKYIPLGASSSWATSSWASSSWASSSWASSAWAQSYWDSSSWASSSWASSSWASSSWASSSWASSSWASSSWASSSWASSSWASSSWATSAWH